jgi:hypothetical protein
MASTDFFIGYTATDQVWAEWIAETLERAGHSTVLQSWDFRPGENFVERMDETVVDAERVVAVLSPAYFRSEYARDEWTAALVRDRGEADRLLPVRVAPAELPPLLANRIYIDLVGVEEPLAAERLQPLGGWREERLPIRRVGHRRHRKVHGGESGEKNGGVQERNRYRQQ